MLYLTGGCSIRYASIVQEAYVTIKSQLMRSNSSREKESRK